LLHFQEFWFTVLTCILYLTAWITMLATYTGVMPILYETSPAWYDAQVAAAVSKITLGDSLTDYPCQLQQRVQGEQQPEPFNEEGLESSIDIQKVLLKIYLKNKYLILL
jgi:hypothetical protein